MLQRARLLPTHNSLDPLYNARLWKKPIWSVEKILKWLDKVSASIVLPKEELCLLNGKSCIKVPVKETELKPPFIKFEPFNRSARPVYQRLSTWPTINLDIAPGESPFRAAPERFLENLSTKSTMRRKTRARVREQRGAHQPGYCEMCHVEYTDLAKHVRSEEHMTFVRNDDNYLSLDSLIAAGASVEAFLRLNGTSSTDDNPSAGTNCRRSARNSTVSLEVRCNGDYGSTKADKRISNIDGGGTLRITRSSSACEKTPKETPAPMSPASSDPGHRLRSRGQLWLPSNLLGTTAEDDGNPAKPGPKESAKHENEHEREENGISERSSNEREDERDRSSRRIPVTTEVDEQILNKNSRHPKDKRKCATRPNAEKTRNSLLKTSRISEDLERGSGNKTYYKVEVLGSKTHLSVSDLRDTDEPKTGTLTRSATANNGACESSSCATDRLVVKFKRVRRSELSVLSDEAENFMFPRRDESSSENDEVDTDDERTNVLSASSDLKCDEQNETRTPKIIEETDDASSSATDAGSHCSAGTNQGSRKRRRTHAELFISDNQKYYKFETPGSRLRFQGSFLPMISRHDIIGDSTATCVKIKDEELLIEPKDENADDVVLPPIERLTYSFERLTKSEPLLRDEIIVDYCHFSDTNRAVPFVMPYEMKPLPPLDPKICKEEFEKRLEATNSHLILDEPECEKSESSKQSESSTHADSAINVSRRKYRKRRNLLHSSSRNPRKSPRQHASTLAILSLLQQRKRRNDKNKSITSSETNDTLSSIPEENCDVLTIIKPKPVELPENFAGNTDIEKMAREIDEMLSQDPLSNDEIPVVSDNTNCFSKEVNIVDLFETYSECTAMEDSISDIIPRRKRSLLSGSPLFAPKGVRRKMKRKKNRTGWPKKKRIFNKKGLDKSEQCDDNESDVAPSERCAGSSVDSDMCNSMSRDCSETREEDEPKVQPREICSRTRNRERCKSSELNNVDSQHETTKLESLIVHEKHERTCSRLDKKSVDREMNQDVTHISEKEFKNSSDHTSTLFNSKEKAGNSVNVDLDKWENAEKLLSIKYIDSSGTETSGFEGRRASSDLQPIVRVQKLNVIEMSHKRRLRNSSSPIRCIPAKRSRRESPIYKNHSRSWRDR